MGAQGESVRSERKRSLVVPVLVMLLIRLAVEANAAQLCRAEITAQKAEAEAAQRLEAEQRSEAARAVQAQASEGETPQFTPDDDVHAAEVKVLTFSVPTSWVEQTRYSEELVEFEPNTYDGFFEAGMVPDLCLAATSAEDAVRQVSSNHGRGQWVRRSGIAIRCRQVAVRPVALPMAFSKSSFRVATHTSS